MSLRRRTPNLFPASNLWTPAHSSVQPLLLMVDANAVWSGSSLSSIFNSGSEGGSFSIRGAVDKGTAINGLDPIRFDNNAEAVYKTLDISNTGKISYFHYGRLITAGINGVINREWNYFSATDRSFVCYSHCSGAGLNSFMIANRSLPGPVDFAPAWEGTSQFQTAGNINSVYGQGGTTNDAWADGVQKAITGTNLSGSFPLAGATPDYVSYDWEFGRGVSQAGGGGETASTEFLCIALFSDWLPTDEREKWEGYWHWRGGTQAQLPAGHPYRNGAPTITAPVPTGILTIDWGNPLTSGLVGAYVPGGDNGGTNLVDPGNGDVALYDTAVDNITGPEGLGMYADGGAMAGTASAAQTTNLTAATVYWRGTNIVDEFPGFGNLFGPDAKADYAAPDRDGFNIRTNSVASTGFQIVWNDGHANTFSLSFGPGLAVGQTGSVAATMLASGNVNTYRDGEFVNSQDFSSFTDPVGFDPTARMQIGGTDHFGRYTSTLSYVGFMWNRVLDATEMATLDADPYAFLIAESSASYAAFSTPQDAGRRVIKIIGY